MVEKLVVLPKLAWFQSRAAQGTNFLLIILFKFHSQGKRIVKNVFRKYIFFPVKRGIL